MRYLSDYYIQTALHRGKAVEQFLGGGTVGDYRTIRWLGVRPQGDRFCLTFNEAIDEGSESFLDLYEFTREPPDEDPSEFFFDTLGEALQYGESAFGARADRWVNEAVIQDEYADYLRTKGGQHAAADCAAVTPIAAPEFREGKSLARQIRAGRSAPVPRQERVFPSFRETLRNFHAF